MVFAHPGNCMVSGLRSRGMSAIRGVLVHVKYWKLHLGLD